ncbi:MULTISPECIES: DUF2147 domain-containing protein [Sphingomonadales]|uniref:DUF2147 domain-containing protein n=2 Tax=Edaphosphingomonas TaxID=3423724 RepID=A0A2T4HJ70_9SPHN|nr:MULTISPECIES: DUF2147 domain-containing protein [Sphingomonas]AGH47934.1 hypothetical protein G432_01030 [Sphingomonas sp. MM-1]MDX3882814.1 DUF2147 domain-containing protein [Sphingomonas sp.]OHT20332.1 hypothetical protein BHE75_02330 [Sphingomonas haloaromaticamans]PTD15848.1 DUF2147 domain-containing protein [Sphingomonas fennica]
MLFTLVALAATANVQPDVVVGRWQTEVRHGVVEITRCGQSICGRLADSDGLKANPALLDANNKDASLRGRRLLGAQILQGFKWGGGAWEGGTIYNAEDGGTYKATVTPVGADQLRLKGCIVWPLCKTQTWTRIR